MSSPRTKSALRAVRWLAPAAALAVTPKCLLCVLAYAGLGAALGLRGPEICGAPSGSVSLWMSLLTWFGATLGGIAAIASIAKYSVRRPLPPCWGRGALAAFTGKTRRGRRVPAISPS